MLCSSKYAQTKDVSTDGWKHSILFSDKMLVTYTNITVTGELAKEPVLSRKSGSIFEKRIVEEYITTSGKDPITDEPCTLDDLVPIRSTVPDIVPPRPPSQSSIPALLSTFQNEWDSLALEVFALRKQLKQAREELSASLYHYDAAVRVAARATKERDEARQALEELTISIGKDDINKGNGDAKQTQDMQTENGKEEIPVAEINSARDELHAIHRSQKPTLPFGPDSNIELTISNEIAKPFKEAVVARIYPLQNVVAISSSTGSTVLLSLNDSSAETTAKINRRGNITSVGMLQLDDTRVPIVAYKNGLKISNAKTLAETKHTDDIFKIINHPSISHIFFLLSKDGTWSLNTIEETEHRTVFRSSSIGDLTCGDIHIDGALLATGVMSKGIMIFDITTGDVVTSIDTAHVHITKICFAQNGYWLLASSTDDQLKESALEIIDLRKNETVHRIDFETGLLDFTIDFSSSIILTYNKNHSLHLHRYIKKGKLWKDFTSELVLSELKELLLIESLSSTDDNAFTEGRQIRFTAISQDSTILNLGIKLA